MIDHVWSWQVFVQFINDKIWPNRTSCLYVVVILSAVSRGLIGGRAVIAMGDLKRKSGIEHNIREIGKKLMSSTFDPSKTVQSVLTQENLVKSVQSQSEESINSLKNLYPNVGGCTSHTSHTSYKPFRPQSLSSNTDSLLIAALIARNANLAGDPRSH
jgi:hypothetical protein